MISLPEELAQESAGKTERVHYKTVYGIVVKLFCCQPYILKIFAKIYLCFCEL